MKKRLIILFASFILLLPSCNNNDDESEVINIEGIILSADAECCTAEEALKIYTFLQTVKIVPELSLVVDGQYEVSAYTSSGTLHKGYNNIYFVATKRSTGNYIKDFDISNISPLMYMVKMNMSHSTPISNGIENINSYPLALKQGWVSFLMTTSDAGSWTLSYDAEVLGKKEQLNNAEIVVDELPSGQDWIKSFKVDNQTYYLSLVDPSSWQTGTNEIEAYISEKSSVITTPYAISSQQFTIDIDPRMPDMGNHTSPDNTSLTNDGNGLYSGTINLTMTGLWRIHLTIRDAEGNIVAGGDDLDNGYSSLYFDVTL